ncbi:hypothetical protein [Clostridium sp.]|uniref:crAss001_48 related protein n=1 Tax=Clostridium sp. TaxID=1506 RepID=UPI00260AFA0C|nr:hypothetical protein [Clostridium sp.]
MLDLKSKLRNLKKYLKEHPENEEPDSKKRHNLFLMRLQSWEMESYLNILIERLEILGI